VNEKKKERNQQVAENRYLTSKDSSVWFDQSLYREGWFCDTGRRIILLRLKLVMNLWKQIPKWRMPAL